MNLTETKAILEKYNIPVKKQFGQNFLLDDSIVNKIVEKSEIDNNTCVIEIGPGLGFLTEKLCQKAKYVLCYEIDEDMINVLNNRLKYDNLEIKHQDFLKSNIDKDIETSFKEFDKITVVANLPYYITTAILIKILEESKYISSMTVMMQLEVAQRICGTPSTKDYNALSVLMQYYTDPKIVIKVPCGSFYPEPAVESAVVKIDYLTEVKYPTTNEAFFKKFNRLIFAQRRKTLANNLKVGFGFSKELIEQILNDNHLSLTIRSEALSVEQIVHLANCFYEKRA